MARRDAGCIYSDGQAITALSQPSTNVVDFSDPSHQIAQAFKVPKLHVKVRQTFTGGGMTVLNIFWQDAPQAVGSTGPNAVAGTFENTGITLLSIPIAALFAGNDLLMVDIPNTGGVLGLTQVPFQPDSLSDSPVQRFSRFLYTVDAIPVTGSLDAWLDTL